MVDQKLVLVHDYAIIDLDIVYRVLKHDLSDIREFVRAVNKLL